MKILLFWVQLLCLATHALALTGWGDSAELTADTRLPSISLLAPTDGDTLRAGDAIAFTWTLHEDSLGGGHWPPGPPIIVQLLDGDELIDEWWPPPQEEAQYELDIDHIWSVHTFEARWLVSVVDGFGNAAADTSGTFAIFGSGEAAGEAPSALILLTQNYPNPFNPLTHIRFLLPSAQVVELSVHDVSGRLIKALHAGRLDSGWHEYSWNAERFGSGLYHAVLSHGSHRQSIKMLLLK